MTILNMGFLCLVIGGRMIKKFLKSIDFLIIAIVFVLFSIGIVALYSANGGIEGNNDEAAKQLMWLGIGFVLMLVLAAIDYEILGRLWIPFYVLIILALFLVLFTEPINRSYELV